MPLSKRLDILQALTEHLEGITPENGYTHDLRGRVFRGRGVFGSSDPTPMVSILEAPRPTEGFEAGEMGIVRAEDWVLLLQGWAEDDRENPTDPAYQLKASVERRLADIIATRGGVGAHSAFRLGGRIVGLLIGPGVCRPPDQVSSRAYFFLPLAVRLAVDLGAPFVAE